MEIAGLATSCEHLFQKICKYSNALHVDNYPEEPSIEREYDRFCLWARNIAALQNAQLPSSLGYRLRHDQKAQKLVVDELKYLEESLHLSLPIVYSEKPNETWDTRDDSDEVDGSQSATYDNEVADNELSGTPSQDSELHQLFTAVQGAVTRLFRLSMMIRKKPKKDDYATAVNTIPMDPTSDIIHVRDKHPILMEERLWLAERLGRAITSRRQYLIYRREHQEKLTAVHHLRTDEDGNTLWSGTRASTYELPGNFVGTQYLPPQPPARTTAATEYADSSKGTEGSAILLRIPLLPLSPTGKRYRYGDNFECPYCWRPQVIKTKAEWKEHVFSDLRPYVCTFESCNHDKFESQNEWFMHELNSHRKQWNCILCKDPELQTLESLGAHFSSRHKFLRPRTRMDIMPACLQPWISTLECPCCHTDGERFQRINESSNDVAVKQFQQHLGRHMEQLALVAVSLDEDESNNSDDDTYGTNSEDIIYSPSFFKHQLEVARKALESEIMEDEKLSGHNHRMINLKIEQLSTIYRKQNKWDESTYVLMELLRKLRITTDLSHSNMLRLRDRLRAELAHNYFIQGRSAQAENLLLEVLQAQRQTLGEHHPDTRLTKMILLRVFLSRGRLDACGDLLAKIKMKFTLKDISAHGPGITTRPQAEKLRKVTNIDPSLTYLRSYRTHPTSDSMD